jgi:hypothetical protein
VAALVEQPLCEAPSDVPGRRGDRDSHKILLLRWCY